MNYILTSEEMREADKYTIERLATPSLYLMEKAGQALADEAERLAPRGKIVCVCGGGNNGGDGFVCARILFKRGRDVVALCVAEKSSSECEINRAEFEMLGGKVKKELPSGKISLIVDCLFGTGFKGELEGKFEEIAQAVNACKQKGVKVLSADIPSGVNGDNGLAARSAIKADETFCLGEYKAGVFVGDGPDFSGKVRKADIGITLPRLQENENAYAYLADRAYVRELLPKRKRNSHKGTYGKTAIVGGSARYSGAPYLSAIAALRGGAGYVCLFLPEKILPAYYLRAPELLLEGISKGAQIVFEEENFEKLLSFDSVAFGMGAGISAEICKGATYLIENYEGKLILDADALNSLAKYQKDGLEPLFARKKCEILITPHVKEFSRLTDLTPTEISASGLSASKPFAKRMGITVLLKNAVSVITNGEKTTVNITGTSAQAKAGSGDVLSGLIASLCAEGLSVFDGAALGAYLAGKAAEYAVNSTGEYSLLASDTASRLGEAFLRLATEDTNDDGNGE